MDTDRYGRGFISAMENCLEGKGVVVHSILPKSKDWDQDLINLSMPLQERLKQAQRLKNQIFTKKKEIINNFKS